MDCPLEFQRERPGAGSFQVVDKSVVCLREAKGKIKRGGKGVRGIWKRCSLHSINYSYHISEHN